MKERPILFSGPMVRAIREGRKTQTRRIVKSQRDPYGFLFGPEYVANEFQHGTETMRCPYGQPGDRLWVRETWAPHADMPTRAAIYRCDPGGDYQDTITPNFRWRPSIYMPRRASRITLEIVSVRVERLWNISEEDAKAEGCEWSQWSFPNSTKPGKSAYRALWESINGHGSWDQNPWVWVIEFKEAKP